MHKITLSSAELIAVITSLEAVGHPSDIDLIKRLQTLRNAPITLDRTNHLSAVIENETLEYSGLFNALSELKYRTSQKPICGEVDLKVLAADAVDAINLQDAGLL